MFSTPLAKHLQRVPQVTPQSQAIQDCVELLPPECPRLQLKMLPQVPQLPAIQEVYEPWSLSSLKCTFPARSAY
jgi:hypothetical protein